MQRGHARVQSAAESSSTCLALDTMRHAWPTAARATRMLAAVRNVISGDARGRRSRPARAPRERSRAIWTRANAMAARGRPETNGRSDRPKHFAIDSSPL
eukprot:8368404-Pyramimonas_sp.AAC.2